MRDRISVPYTGEKIVCLMNPVRHEDRRRGVLRRVTDTVSTKGVKYQYCIQHKY
jgi:hypothetical protein